MKAFPYECRKSVALYRVISVAVSLMLLCTSWSFDTVMAADTAAVDENFNSYADIEELKANASYTTENSGNVSLAEYKSHNDKSILFQNGSGNLKKSWAEISDSYVVISNMFMQPTLGNMRLQQVWSGANSGGSRPYLISVGNDQGIGKIFIQYGPAGSAVTLSEYTTNIWYQVTTITDLKNKGIYVFLDGQQINTQPLAFWNDVSTIASINIQAESNNTYVDNLYVDSFRSLDAAIAAVKVQALYGGTETGELSQEERTNLKSSAEEYMAILRNADDAAALRALEGLVDGIIPDLRKVIYTEDFESYDENAAFGNEYVAKDNATVVSEGASKAAKLSLSDAGARARLLKELPVGTTNNLSLSFRFMQKEKAPIDQLARTVDDTYNKVVYQIYSDGEDVYVSGSRTVEPYKLIADYAANVWYDLKVEINYRPQCFSVYAYNGETLLGSVRNINFQDNLSSQGNTIKRIFDSYTNTPGTYYLDDIIAVEQPVPAYENRLQTVALKDADGNVAYTLADGGSVETVYYKCNEESAKLIMAIYGTDNLLVSAKIVDVHDTNGLIEKTDVGLALPQSADACTVKVFLWDGDADALNPLDESMVRIKQSDAKPTLFIAGDSTVATYENTYYPQAGWGMMLGNYLTDAVNVDNRAIPGYSLKQFMVMGYYDALLQASQPGDTVLIQFAHNDQKLNEKASYARALVEYKAYIAQYVAMARDRGVNPILVTPPVRKVCGSFTGDARLVSYADAMRAVAEKLNVPLIDLFSASKDMILDCYGADSAEAEAIYLFLEANDGRYTGDVEFENSVYNKDSATQDSTHFCRYGADVLAKMVAEELKNVDGWDSLVDLSYIPVAPAAN